MAENNNANKNARSANENGTFVLESKDGKRKIKTTNLVHADAFKNSGWKILESPDKK